MGKPGLSQVFGQEEKLLPRAYGRKNLALARKGQEEKLLPRAYVQISRLSGRAEDGEGVCYLQGLLGEAETASGASTFGAGGFTLTGGGELPTAS